MRCLFKFPDKAAESVLHTVTEQKFKAVFIFEQRGDIVIIVEHHLFAVGDIRAKSAFRDVFAV